MAQLVCSASSHPPIDLPNGTAVTIGRDPLTQIQDKQVSRQHVELTADYNKHEIKVHQLGNKPCEVDGRMVSKGETAILAPGSTLNLLIGKYSHQIKFLSAKRSRSNENDEREEKKMKEDSSDAEDSEQEEIKKKFLAFKSEMKKYKKPDDTEEAASEQKPVAVQPRSVTRVADGWSEPEHRLIVYHPRDSQGSAKIAGFDIDGTIITTKSGRVFPVDTGDWRIIYPEVPGRLKKLVADGYKIVFFTNQSGIQRGRLKVPDFQKKVECILQKLGLPIQVLVSSGTGRTRKPGGRMWTFMLEQMNDGVEVDMEKSFYVGDAAGRPKDWIKGKKKDHSCADRLFALNLRLPFSTPEEFFLKQKPAQYDLPDFNPTQLGDLPLLSPASASPHSKEQEVIILVGSPASGKSHFAKTYLISKGYTHVNRDTLKTWQKCVAATKAALSAGSSVVVDNTNPDPESRARYLSEAKSAGVPCRCFVMAASASQCKHNERFREMTDKTHEAIHDMILNSYKSKFVEPAPEEGFNKIVKVNFVPQFNSKEEEKLYTSYILDK